MAETFSELYPTLAELVEGGAHMEVNGGGYHLQIAALYEESQLICQFACSGMSPDAILEELNELALRYVEEGMVTDSLNGSEYCIG